MDKNNNPPSKTSLKKDEPNRVSQNNNPFSPRPSKTSLKKDEPNPVSRNNNPFSPRPSKTSLKYHEPKPMSQNPVKNDINNTIGKDRVVIFAKSTCPYCDDAKKVFDRLGQSYSVVELADHPQKTEYQSALKEMTGAGTVPRVFVDGVCIGGGSDTKQLYKAGRLEQILRQGSEESIPREDAGSGEKFM